MKTVLCVPGHDAEKVEKCRKYGADLILFDLEDSVPDNRKAEAREIVAKALTAADAVRVNSLDRTDVSMLHSAGVLPHSVWLPKMSHWPLFDAWRVPWGGLYPLVVIVETPALVLRLPELLTDSRTANLRGLAFGVADFCSNARTIPRSELSDHARMQVALTAAALKIEAYDAPCLSMADGNAVAFEAHTALFNGFTSKGVLNPTQLDIVKRANYSFDQREWGRLGVQALTETGEVSVVQPSNFTTTRTIVAKPMLPMLRRLAGMPESEDEK